MGASALVVALLLAGPIITFEWMAPGSGPAPDRYEVEFSQGDEDPQVLVTNQPGVSLTPTLGDDFRIRVRACVQAACSEWSEPSTAMSLNRSADFDANGIVGVSDYSGFVRAFGTSGPADLDGDTVVGTPDYAEFAEHFGSCVGDADVDGATQPAYVDCGLGQP